MTQEQAVQKFLDGELVALGEYRLSKSEMLEWRDKTNGKPMSAPMLRHTVEFGSVSVAVSERVPDTMKLEDIRVPFTKGDAVICHFSEIAMQKGLVSARGTLEKVTRSPAKAPAVGVGVRS